MSFWWNDESRTQIIVGESESETWENGEHK